MARAGVEIPCDVEGVAQSGMLVPANEPPVKGPFIIGMGDSFAGVEDTPSFYEMPMKMVSIWMSSSGDLSFLMGLRPSVLDYYANGYAIEFILWLADHGDYAISTQVITDVTNLEPVLRPVPGGPPLFCCLFTEWETQDNAGTPYTTAQLATFKQNYITLANMFRAGSPNTYVGLSNGGYSWSGSTSIDVVTGFEAVNAASDFTAVQAMQADGNANGPGGINEIIPNFRNSVRDLGKQIAKPVFISHTLTWDTNDPGGDEVSVFDSWQHYRNTIFGDPAAVDEWRNLGLFAVNFQNGGAAWYFYEEGQPNGGLPATIRQLSRLANQAPQFPLGRGLRFSADGQDYSSTNSAPTGSYTITCWAKINTDRNAISTVWSAGSSSTVHNLLQTLADGTTLTARANNGAVTITGPNMVVGTWYRLGLVVNGATATLYWGTEGGTLTSASSGSWPTVTGYTSLQIGESIIGTQWLNGCVANFKHYSTTLTADEVAADLRSYRPQYRTSCVRWHPFRGENLPADLSGNSRTLSGGSGVGVESGPATIRWQG